MTRVKRGAHAAKRRSKTLKYAKGYRWGRKNKERYAREALLHAWTHAFQHRKKKKGEMRGLWNAKISAALEEKRISYSRLIHALAKSNIRLNRKMLARLAEEHPKAFEAILAKVEK